jgi:drug/metabolite transporter (DMT)-like permease
MSETAAAQADEERRRRVLRSIGFALGAALCFVGVPICVRYLSAWLGSSEIVFLRNLVGFSLLLPWATRAVWRAGWSALAPGPFHLHVLRALCNGGGMIVWFYAIAHMKISDAMALQFTLPLWTMIFAVAFLGERIGPRRIAALAVGFGGVLVIMRPGFEQIGLPAGAALTAAALYALAVVLIRRQAQSATPTIIMFYTTILMALVGLGPALFDWRPVPLAAVPWLVGLGTVGFLAQFFLAHALRLAEAKVVIIFDFLRMPLAAAAAFVLFGELSDLWTWIGAAVIFGAVYYIAQRDAKMARKAPPTGNTD